MSSVMALKGFNCKIFVIGETKYKEDILKLNQDTNVLYKFMKSSYSIIPHLKLTKCKFIFFDLTESIKHLSLVKFIKKNKNKIKYICFDDFYSKLIDYDFLIQPFNQNKIGNGKRNILKQLKFLVFSQKMYFSSRNKKFNQK